MSKKNILVSVWIALCFTVHAFSQSSNEKSICFSNNKLQIIFKILRTQPNTISPSCIETLRRLHAFTDQLTNTSGEDGDQKDINLSTLRSLYENTLELCQVDAKQICSHDISASIRTECRSIPK